ncbi:arylesterase [Microbulbifer thermotolerans]|uniref:Arylesterase n=2 Tax=Microbulbifer thermotolerans TaxID=252514 RepID=A0A143HMP2_MICTH|nr:arylesterase [Microbulbifer thermotolerans]AMX02995.1 arylesterase [Microbulbifer thermotolerans]MCX2834545.1 arylesterase [Microbulbifer thermotolerans]MCX2841746.1 arylesterase [Microbulbifer thermotolerans]WKT59514.1 arylesterase [Microbulbifer thermotolerans]SFC71506.1 acyl-CoA thioesterase-1 [Microbulbifer thermotolerans]
MTTDFFRRLYLYFGLCLMLSIPLGQARAADRLVVLGDSISAAYGIDEAQGWVQLLRERLQGSEKPIEVINASISGETSSGGLARLPRLLEEHRPRWLIVELGGNDGLRGYPPLALQRNLQKMVNLAQNAGAEVLLLGMRMPPNYGRAYTEAFAAVYPKVAEAEEIPLVPFFLEPVALMDGAMQSDGIHPTAVAQPVLLDHIWPCVQVLLGQAVGDESCTP